MINKIRNWLDERKKRIAHNRRMEMQKADELFFSIMFDTVKEGIQSRTDCTQEQKDRMISNAERTHKESIESRRKLREEGKDIQIGI